MQENDSQWQVTTKETITKEFFPSVERRLAVNLHLHPNVIIIMSGHGNIPSYLTPLNPYPANVENRVSS
jgi:hypothetical protein